MLAFKDLQEFSKSVTENFSTNIDAQPEDQLKPAVTNLLKSIGQNDRSKIVVRTEARHEDVRGRPDLGVAVDGLLSGFIELKAPGLGSNPERLKGDQNRKQWENFKSIPNLIYTDGNEWSLFRTGKQIGKTVRLNGDITKDGIKAVIKEDADNLQSLLLDFLNWNPIVPRSPRDLAKYLAPLTRFLRHEVELALETEDSALSLLAREWRNYLFPEVDNHQFADAYAQTLTYALLLARISGADDLSPDAASNILDKGNSLLATTLKILAQKEAREEISVGYDLLVRFLSALDPSEVLKRAPDLWLYFYEDFLAAYDPKLRKDYGVYYTPVAVVECQVRLVSQLLKERFGKKLSFADDGVTFLDPAVGTGTYLVYAIQHALRIVRDRSGPGAVPGRASLLAKNMYAFEFLVGPYAVAHLRLTQEILSEGGSLPDGRLQVYLADTLESPFTTPPGALDLTHKPLVEERRRAREVKETKNILVCIGNPPYDRQTIEQGDSTTQRKGGWVRFRDEGQQSPILEDFLDPARRAGQSVHLKNLYNDYVYFWRWALWKLFEHQDTGGVLSFITASSYLAGPGFVGMREVMRRTFDELWIINLEGDNLGARKTENVFNIQIPVAIAVGVCKGKPNRNTPAKVHYTKITGTREDKLGNLETVKVFEYLKWRDCPSGWQDRFLPEGTGDFFAWPALTDIFPWQQSGVKIGRTWPLSFDPETLKQRWKTIAGSGSNRKGLFVERPTGRKAKDRPENSYPLPVEPDKSILDLDASSKMPDVVRYGYRSFDRMYILADARLIDRASPSLWTTHSNQQIYMATLFAQPLGHGMAATLSSSIPDLDCFRGSFGAKYVTPLWRDSEATQSNVTNGLLDTLSREFKRKLIPEDLFAYCYAILVSPAYVETFWEELSTPGPRIPITKKPELFDKAVEAGRRLIWLHTYGERFVPKRKTQGDVPVGKAKCLKAISDTESAYPEEFSYDTTTNEIHFGDGRFGHVLPEVWEFEVSGLKVVQSWLSYRRKSGSGKRSSSLDEIRPRKWTAQMTDEFLELLWVLEHTVAMFPDLQNLLEKIVAGPCFSAKELPQPTEAERQSPKVVIERGSKDTSQGKLL